MTDILITLLLGSACGLALGLVGVLGGWQVFAIAAGLLLVVLSIGYGALAYAFFR